MDVTLSPSFQPRARRPARAPSAPRSQPSSGDASVAPARDVVLVVDDTEDIRDLYADALRDAGYEVFTASDGLAAVELAARVRPAHIVMDLAMPNMDGWDATRTIRASAPPDERRPTILAVSAFSGTQARTEAFDAGADGFIDKPCAPDVLVSVIALYLDARRR